MNNGKRSMWVDVGKQVLSFVVGVIVAAFVLGRGIQKINAVADWKDQIAPKIERMDSIGTLSFDHFHKQYDKDQHRVDERLKAIEHNRFGADRLKEMEQEIKELQKKVP
jgi:hypothetical protein